MIRTFNCSGCLIILLSFLSLIFLFKLGIFVFFIFIILLLIIPLILGSKFLYEKFKGFLNNKTYKSKPGRVYKQCGFCNEKSDRNSATCINCGRPFD